MYMYVYVFIDTYIGNATAIITITAITFTL